MRACLILLLFASASAACGSSDTPPSAPAANATIIVASTSFSVSDWRFRLHTDPNAAKVELVASNGNTCALMTNPNGANVRLIHMGAFSIINVSTGATALPTEPGTFPIEEDAVLGNAGAVWFYATGASAQPLVLTNQAANPTAPYADNGNVVMTAFDPNTCGSTSATAQAGCSSIEASAIGSIQGTLFNYVFAAQPCP